MADERLYRFFDERLDKEVREFGLKNMKRSIKEIRRLSEQVNKFCGEDEGGGGKEFRPHNKRVKATKVRCVAVTKLSLIHSGFDHEIEIE